MSRQIYNALLGESLRLLALMRRIRNWQARKCEHKRGSVPALSHVIIDRFDFKQSALERLAIVCRRGCATSDPLGPHEAQAVARRTFLAVQQYAFGLRGRPPLQGIPRASTRSKAKATRQGSASVSARSSGMAFRSRPCSILRDRDGWQAAALSSETKYYRVIRWTIRGQDRW
jgi:hypothetical protein